MASWGWEEGAEPQGGLACWEVMPGAGVLGGARVPGLALTPDTWPWVVEGAGCPEAGGWPVVLVASSGDPGPVLRGWLHLGGRLALGSHLRLSRRGWWPICHCE